MARPKKLAEVTEAAEDQLPHEAGVQYIPEVAEKPKKKVFEVPNFDYRNLTGDEFKRYNEFLSTLKVDGHYDFVLLKVNPVFLERYPGLPNSPKDFSGVVAKSDIPEHTTRILLSQANDYNQQIYNDAAKRNGKYYLLKK